MYSKRRSDMPTFQYSKSHIEKLREFFGNKERNEKFRTIMKDFPESKLINQLGNTNIRKLHIKVIKKLLKDIYLSYRQELVKWAEITKQTAIVDPEYLSMHLVSVFTGIPGTGTAARGYDLSDGSEVKSSSRVEQLGKCRDCGAAVMSFEDECGNCGSENIERKYDSHWIFSLRDEQEVKNLLSTPLIYLVLLDYEDVEKRDTIRIRIWKLNPKDPFVRVFFRHYYFEEYYKKRLERGERPAPCNLHPDKPLTKSLKPMLVFLGKIDFVTPKIDIEFISSKGAADKISESEARGLLSRRRGFLKKVVELGMKNEYEQRVKELREESKRGLEEFMVSSSS
jgi:hypothetical protein